MRRAILSLLIALAVGLPAPRAMAQDRATAFSIDDYFALVTVVELTLSDDGKWLAYVVAARDAAGATQRTVFVQRLDGGAAKPTPALAGGRAFAWAPGRNELIFLRGQVQGYDPATQAVRTLTNAGGPVSSYKLAPDGAGVAYQIERVLGPEPSRLYDQLYDGDKGVVIDTDFTGLQNFVDPKRPTLPGPSRSTELWVAQAGGAPVKATLPGDPRSYAWSSDGRALSVTYLAKSLEAVERPERFTSVGVLDLASGRFIPIAVGAPPADGRLGVAFLGGEWVPGQAAIYLRRVIYDHPWISTRFPSLSVVAADKPLPARTRWRAMEAGDAITPVDRRRALLETTSRGRRTLQDLVVGKTVETTPLAGLPEGSNWGFRFSRNRRDAVFVNESLSRPQEIFIRHGSGPATRLTALNIAVAARITFTSREVNWKGSGGVTIHGWLLEPAGEQRAGRPTVVQVHGGPLYAVTDTFAPQFPLWPYPFEVMAERGYAVFLPNYRGTQSYGPVVGLPDDDKAVEDIILGVRALIDAGVSTAGRIGITGHSHGGLLGPRVLVGSNGFKVASFAEGMPDMIVTYQLMGGYLNREVHDPIIGVSLYDNPQRYLDISAALHLKGVSTAMLVEAGGWAGAISNLNLPKAAKRAGIPAEYVVYPKTAHNLSAPALQREAAQRNLDWFAFWMDNVQDPDPAKAEQYRRWTRLKDAPAAP